MKKVRICQRGHGNEKVICQVGFILHEYKYPTLTEFVQARDGKGSYDSGCQSNLC